MRAILKKVPPNGIVKPVVIVDVTHGMDLPGTVDLLGLGLKTSPES